ncbi:MAG: hypothetical protein FWG05_00740 [Kiritimatiellaeota bacterium]|nr:hypothetical protein [Kiritimatiellota bacterium]
MWHRHEMWRRRVCKRMYSSVQTACDKITFTKTRPSVKTHFYVVVFFIITNTCLPCYYEPDYVADRTVFQLVGATSRTSDETTGDANIREWRALINNAASEKDIAEVLYKIPLDKMDAPEHAQNSFIKYLHFNFTKEAREALDYVRLAKICETEREKHNRDSWFYPMKKDLTFDVLRDVVSNAVNYAGTRFESRYLLQAMRAAFTMEDYEFCNRLWNERIGNLPETEIKRLCRGYAGGAAYHTGNYAGAVTHYLISGDNGQSLMWALQRAGAKSGDWELDALKRLLEFDTKHWGLESILIGICTDCEKTFNRKFYCEYENYTTWYEQKPLIKKRDFMLATAFGGKTGDPAMWLHAASFLEFYINGPEAALKILALAREKAASPQAAAAMDELKIWFTVHTLPAGEELETYLADNLEKISREEVRDKIMLNVVLPKYRAAHDFQKVLEIAARYKPNDYYYYDKKDFGIEKMNVWSSRCVLFYFMNAVPTVEAAKFTDAYDGSGWHTKEWLNDLVGTRHLRNEEYAEAAERFAEVSDDFVRRMRVAPYLKRDPFALPGTQDDNSVVSANPKFDFARKMTELKSRMEALPKGDEKAAAILEYVNALRNSFDWCWALTRYYQSYGTTDESLFNGNYGSTPSFFEHRQWKYTEMIAAAKSMSDDPEIHARAFMLNSLILNKRNFNGLSYSDFKRLHSGTEFEREFAARCDSYNDYVQNAKPE